MLENNTASSKKEWNQYDSKTIEMKEIIKEQEKERERENKLEKQRLKDKVPKSTLRRNLVMRDTFDKNRCIMIVGDIEGHQEVRYEREREMIG